jgi:hypothetical protein
MKNPGIFIAAPSVFNSRQLKQFKRALREMARDYGYPAYRGKGGSIFALLAAIVGGEIALVRLPDEERRAAIRRLRELARVEEDYIAADAFRDLADALERAATREENT